MAALVVSASRPPLVYAHASSTVHTSHASPKRGWSGAPASVHQPKKSSSSLAQHPGKPATPNSEPLRKKSAHHARRGSSCGLWSTWEYVNNGETHNKHHGCSRLDEKNTRLQKRQATPRFVDVLAGTFGVVVGSDDAPSHRRLFLSSTAAATGHNARPTKRP